MRIVRYRKGKHSPSNFCYIYANFFERIYLHLRMLAGDSGLWPRDKRLYGVSFILTAKHKKPKPIRKQFRHIFFR
jgi:hypothetical protein